MAFFTNMLKFASIFTKRPALTPISDFILWLLAKLTIRIKGAEHRESVEEIGKEWQKMFPSRAFVPIKEVSGDTVYAEILGACPIAGTGDVQACYRLMEYDPNYSTDMTQMVGYFKYKSAASKAIFSEPPSE